MSAVIIIVAYFSLAVFVIVAVYRTLRVATLPVHLRWELAPVPHEKGRSHYGGSYLEEYEWWKKPRSRSLISELIYMLEEILLLRGVWEHHRRLWWFSLPFHTGIYLLIGAGALLLVAAGLDWAGAAAAGVMARAAVAVALVGHLLGALGALGLLVRRLTDPRLVAVRTAGTLFNLVFLLAVFTTGAAAVAMADRPARRLVECTQAVLTADFSAAIPGLLAVHLLLAFLLLAYLPFTPMLHFVAKYFTYHRVRWDDDPLVARPRLEGEVKELLEQPVSWSAPHVASGGGKRWIDIARELPEE